MNDNKVYLNDDFDRIWARIKNGDNITVFRYGDGERSLILGKPVHAQEGWLAPEGQTPLGKALEKTLDLESPDVYYGISCPCCDKSAYYWYKSHIKSKNTTFANLFVNANYRKFRSCFEELKRNAVVIANHNGERRKIGNLNVLKYYSVGDQCVNFYEEEVPKLISQIKKDFNFGTGGGYENLLFVVSAGPLSEPIIYELYKSNPNNAYIDFGSSIDFYIHGKDTRPYTDATTIFGKRNCWMEDPMITDFDVTVVLTTYKKPDALALQLEAIKKQTLKPKEIFLFQDGINGNYSINFKDELLKNFNKVHICSENMGVWERFRFAKENASCKYVCMFDDDTIPGSRWLENCHSQMMNEEGIYGTVGIVLQKPELYPYKGFFRVGWHRPYSKTARVDFVGHSWFFKKEYLDYMFDGTEEFQKYKTAAEDMCLSFKCKQHGINTFVPPHPYWDLEQWGSKPKYGMKFGMASTAISQNFDNCMNMRNAIKEYMKLGWTLVIDEEKSKVKKVNREIKFEYKKAFIKKVIKKVLKILRIAKK